MAASDPLAPFFWGSGGERLTPESIKRRRDLANQLIKGGVDYSPVGHWTQGLARVAQALVGGYEAGKLDKADEKNATESQKRMAGLLGALGGGTASPDVPAAGASPVSGGAGAGLGSVSPAANVPGDLAGRKQAIVQGLVERGLSPNAAAAYAGNFAVENNAHPIGGVGDNGTAFGLAQWRLDRFTALKALAASQGKDWRDLGVQLDHVVREHNAMPEAYRNTLASADPGQGADLVMRRYERPSNKAMADTGARRAAMALAAFNGFKPTGGAIASRGAQDDPSIPDDGPGVPLAYNPAPTGSAAADASRVATGGGPRMVLSPQNPLFTPQQAMAGAGSGPSPSPVAMALANPAADLPAPGASQADIPAQGAQPAGFVIPPAQSGGQMGYVPTAEDQANTPAAGAQPVQQPAAPVRVAQTGGINPAIIQALASPYASQEEKSIAAILLQQHLQSQQRDKPDWGVIGKDEFGREQYGFIDKRRQSVSPYSMPQSTPTGPSAIPPTPPGVDPKVWRETHSKRLSDESAGPKPDEVTGLRKEIQQLPSYKNIAQAVPIYRSMMETAGRNTKASDLNLVYGLGKIMDPGSVVREGEMVMVKNTAALPEWLHSAISQLNGGAALTPETRKQIMLEAFGRMQGYQQQFALDSEQYGGIADRMKANRLDVIPSFGDIKPWSPAPQQSAQPQPQPAIPEGATATHPGTGQRLRMQGGRWVPLQ